jgi:hypothetical protein
MSNNPSKPQSSFRNFFGRRSKGKQPQKTVEKQNDPLQSPTAEILRLDIPNTPSSDRRLLDTSSVDSRCSAPPEIGGAVAKVKHHVTGSSRSRDEERVASMAKTAVEAFKIALNALNSASRVIPHGGVLSPAINGVLMAIDVVEVRSTASYYVCLSQNCFQKKYENAEVLNELADRTNRLEPFVMRLRDLGGADLTHFFSKLVRYLEAHCFLVVCLSTSLPSIFEELSKGVLLAKSQGTLSQFIHGKGNASSLEKCRKKLDAIVDDATVGIRLHPGTMLSLSRKPGLI